MTYNVFGGTLNPAQSNTNPPNLPWLGTGTKYAGLQNAAIDRYPNLPTKMRKCYLATKPIR